MCETGWDFFFWNNLRAHLTVGEGSPQGPCPLPETSSHRVTGPKRTLRHHRAGDPA